jgi:hypothetical protein
MSEGRRKIWIAEVSAQIPETLDQLLTIFHVRPSCVSLPGAHAAPVGVCRAEGRELSLASAQAMAWSRS